MTPPVWFILLMVIIVLAVAASTWSWFDIIRRANYTTALWRYTAENLEYAARMNQAAASYNLGIRDEDTAWYESGPPLPEKPVEPKPVWPLRVRIGVE